MLVTLKEVTQDALKNHYAVGAYNIHNLEYTKAVVETSY
jgi:fructose/tagatose bisphosphate aldolase